MKEELLHFIWKYKLFYASNLRTTTNNSLEVLSVGAHNLHAGPDFFNSKVRIANQLWAGNVEIHIKASDWYVHGHENDKQYDALILHVVWENDVDVFDRANNVLPTIELNNVVSKELLKTYQELFSKSKQFINCEASFYDVSKFTIANWMERLYVERLENKSIEIEKQLNACEYNWEQVLFQLLAKNFGLKVNSEVFFKMTTSLDYGIVRKESQNLLRLESLLFGQLGMLVESFDASYFLSLKQEYDYQRKKYELESVPFKVQYFRLRPTNFPTIRVSQLAHIIHIKKQLFSDLMATKTLEEYYKYFNSSTSEFWQTHFTFGTISKKSSKKLTKAFIDLLLINTVIPLKFVYLKNVGKLEMNSLFSLIQQIKPENNSIVKKYGTLGFPVSNAFETQALIQLKNNYCAPQKCLQCAIGHELLRS